MLAGRRGIIDASRINSKGECVWECTLFEFIFKRVNAFSYAPAAHCQSQIRQRGEGRQGESRSIKAAVAQREAPDFSSLFLNMQA
jgi:hypothetical protein